MDEGKHLSQERFIGPAICDACSRATLRRLSLAVSDFRSILAPQTSSLYRHCQHSTTPEMGWGAGQHPHHRTHRLHSCS